jgi:hypothetical protein
MSAIFMPSNRIARAHDSFVRTVLSDPRIAREFFEIYLPKAILKVIDLDHLDKTTIARQEIYLYLML